MDYNDIAKIFTEDNIMRYKGYFDFPNVIDEANKIVDAVKSTKNLTYEENMASVILAAIILN